MSSGSSTAPKTSSPGNGITGGYTGDSFTVKTCIVFFSGLAIYNALELIVLIFFTFSRYSGLYFWSLLVSSICVIPYALSFMFKFLLITAGNTRWLTLTLITTGWYGMVTGQSVVLWSRLGLLLQGDQKQRTLRWTKWMIIINAIVLGMPATVLTWGSNGDVHVDEFVRGYNVVEKIQMCGFFLQEVVLSALYIREAARLLRESMRDDAKKFLWQLVSINVLIIIMDLALLSIEAASLYLWETLLKGTIYSIKLKLEFAILGKLIHFVGGPTGSSVNQANEDRWRKASVAYMKSNESEKNPSSDVDAGDRILSMSTAHGDTNDLSDFVDLSKSRTHLSHNSDHSRLTKTTTAGALHGSGGRQRKRTNTLNTQRGITELDVDLARFEHGDDLELQHDELDDGDHRTQHTIIGDGHV